jgi:hypothetical protein
LDSDEPWDTLKAQLLVRVDSSLGPSRLDFDNYNFQYIIRKLVPKPGRSLQTENDYDYMLEQVMKAKSDKEIQLFVEEKDNGEDESGLSADEVQVKGKKKSKKAKGKVKFQLIGPIYCLIVFSRMFPTMPQ